MSPLKEGLGANQTICVYGSKAFVEGFAQFLGSQKVEFQELFVGLQDLEIAETNDGKKSDLKNFLYFTVDYELIKTFSVALAPIIIQNLILWYRARKNHGKIILRINGTVIKLDAKNIDSFEYNDNKKKPAKKKKARKKKTSKP